ncbi:unnamed protein product [Effrenium voratum]|uniref:Uncharacterized protein n=1 Tax=Effrenium voratum TaxID=2562239 RepID=A0AA36MRS6_9DINO|nr:unnamed protein product [Effrenium voratum]
MELPPDFVLPDNFVGTAKATAASRLEGQDRCAVVHEELRRLFSKGSKAAAKPKARSSRDDAPALPAVAAAARPPRPAPLEESSTWSSRKSSFAPERRPSKPPTPLCAALTLSSEEQRGLAQEYQLRSERPWSQEEENRELRRQLMKMGINEARPHFESLAAENHWLRRQVTAKLLKAWLSEGPSGASTRVPTPSSWTGSESKSRG